MLNIFPGPNINDWFLRKSLNNSLQLIVRYKVFDGYTVYRSINDILYRKLKASKLRIKNLTHTFVNTMFHFRINASIVAFLSNHISFAILMTTFFKICFKILKKPQVLHHLAQIIHHSSIIFIFCRPCFCHACCLAWSTRIMFHPMFPGEHGVEHCQKERRLAN